MNKNKIVLLDLGGVVFQSTGKSNELINWKIISQLNNKYGHDLNIGKDKFGAFLKEYNRLTSQDLEGKAFLKAVFDTLTINQELINLLKEEYEIIIVSDNYRENIAYISKRYNFKSWAKGAIYSFDYEMVKSNPAFFQKLLMELPYRAEELLFIDDSLNKIESASKSGIKGILFVDNAQVKRALEKI